MLRRLAVNTGSNVGVLVVRVGIMFVLTPVLVHNLGRYDYGLWEMLMAIIGYAGILELGFRPTVSRFAAKYRGEQDRVALQRLFNTALAFLSTVGLLVALALASTATFFPHLLAPPEGDSARYTILLLILGLHVLAAFPGHVAESLLEGFQNYYLKNIVAVIKMLITGGLTLAFITPENGILLLAGVGAAGLWIRNMVFFALVMTARGGGFRPRPRDVSFRELKTLARFGSKSLIQGISTRIENATDTIIIGFVLGPAMVPLYSIPANLVQYLRTLTMTLTHAFMPLFSDLSARGQQNRIVRIYLTASKYTVGLMLPAAAGTVVVGPPFLEVWIGPEIATHSQVIVLLLVTFMILPYLNPFASRFLTAIDQHGIFARLGPVSAAINLVLTIALVNMMGIVGAALASVVAVAAFFPLYLRHTARHLGITSLHYLRTSVLPALGPTALMVLVVGMYRLEFPPDSYRALLTCVLLGAVVYLPTFWFMALTGGERVEFLQRLVALRRR